jgi:hypothetical protein
MLTIGATAQSKSSPGAKDAAPPSALSALSHFGTKPRASDNRLEGFAKKI